MIKELFDEMVDNLEDAVEFAHAEKKHQAWLAVYKRDDNFPVLSTFETVNKEELLGLFDFSMDALKDEVFAIPTSQGMRIFKTDSVDSIAVNTYCEQAKQILKDGK